MKCPHRAGYFVTYFAMIKPLIKFVSVEIHLLNRKVTACGCYNARWYSSVYFWWTSNISRHYLPILLRMINEIFPLLGWWKSQRTSRSTRCSRFLQDSPTMPRLRLTFRRSGIPRDWQKFVLLTSRWSPLRMAPSNGNLRRSAVLRWGLLEIRRAARWTRWLLVVSCRCQSHSGHETFLPRCVWWQQLRGHVCGYLPLPVSVKL